jgi:hypothetical protein
MTASTLEPDHSTLAITAPPHGFCPGDRVWVHRANSWRPGIVLHSSAEAATVRYRPAEGRGTGVDTVTANSLAPRDDDDPFLDQPR